MKFCLRCLCLLLAVTLFASPARAQVDRAVLMQFGAQQFPRSQELPIRLVTNDVKPVSADQPFTSAIAPPTPIFPPGSPSSAEIVPAPTGQEPWRPSPSAFDNSGLFEPSPLSNDLPLTHGPVARSRLFVAQIVADHKNYYTWQNFGRMSLIFGGGAILANTNLDQQFRDSWQNNIGQSSTLHAFKVFGEGLIVVPSYAAAMLIGATFDERPVGGWIGQWGQRSFRATAVGFPPMLLMQFVTGASRPGEQPYNSAWKPFQDNNGVSGHAFMGSIPFLTAAQMTDSIPLKVVLVGGSTLTGLSRINDDAHYLSQVILGWSMGVFAVSAVNQTEGNTGVRIFPYAAPNANGLTFEWRR